MSENVRIICPGDIHCTPGYDNDRLEWLGHLVVERRPTHVVFPGDLGDYPSLCRYEKGRAQAEGRRVAKDEAAVADGLERFWGPIRALHVKQAAGNRKRYRPELICLGGNHDEERLWRLGDEHPELAGMEETFKELVREAGFTYVPYKAVHTIAGFHFSHHFPSGPMGRPVMPGPRLLSRMKESCVVGHEHQRSVCSDTRPGSGTKMHAIGLGCYVHEKYTAPWCRDTVKFWDNGVTEIDGAQNGDYAALTWTSQKRLRELYG